MKNILIATFYILGVFLVVNPFGLVTGLVVGIASILLLFGSVIHFSLTIINTHHLGSAATGNRLASTLMVFFFVVFFSVGRVISDYALKESRQDETYFALAEGYPFLQNVYTEKVTVLESPFIGAVLEKTVGDYTYVLSTRSYARIDLERSDPNVLVRFGYHSGDSLILSLMDTFENNIDSYIQQLDEYGYSKIDLDPYLSVYPGVVFEAHTPVQVVFEKRIST